MHTLSGIALIAAAILLLVASRRACQRCEDAWFTSDSFVLIVIGPISLLGLVGGVGMLLYSGARTASTPAAIVGLACAALVSLLAAYEWIRTPRKAQAATHSADVIAIDRRAASSSDRPTAPDAPRPPVTPRKAA
jgi:hypothetical protein